MVKKKKKKKKKKKLSFLWWCIFSDFELVFERGTFSAIIASIKNTKEVLYLSTTQQIVLDECTFANNKMP